MQEKLLLWYDQNARTLPWRVRGGRGDPYRVWVSEVMLQQTRAEAVIPYFERFMAALPDIPSLSAVDTDVLYKLWEGLGYYSRARNLQKAARILVEHYNGALPADFEALLTLPGIGDYTAGAIASIAYGIPVPAVDGNVLRVFARYSGDARDILALETRRDIRALVARALPETRPGDFNQALMDLGATVCVPNTAPRCGLCPLRDECVGCADGTAALLPNRAPKKARRIEDMTVFVLRCGTDAALSRRGEGGVLAGQWELPNVAGTLSAEEAWAALRKMGVEAEALLPLPAAKHVFTHIEWHMTGYLVYGKTVSNTLTWFDRDALEVKIALPSAFRAYRPYLTDQSPRA
ncbi:MAG: A/G-specific adenine glycosylase [Clostridiaceae bacterium]|nr:A/G-specific adenine glycosylase [Clostridiaceae bacterium]